jgi:hypothetical protein
MNEGVKFMVERANPTFAIRGEKRLFLGMNRHETLDFKPVLVKTGRGEFLKWAVVPTYPSPFSRGQD